jgi:hypothetical protein
VALGYGYIQSGWWWALQHALRPCQQLMLVLYSMLMKSWVL